MFEKNKALIFDKVEEDGLITRSRIIRKEDGYDVYTYIHDGLSYFNESYEYKNFEKYDPKKLNKAIIFGDPTLAFDYKTSLKYGKLVAEYDIHDDIFDDLEFAGFSVCIEAVRNWRSALGGCSIEALGTFWKDIDFETGFDDEADACVHDIYELPLGNWWDWGYHELDVVSDLLLWSYPDYIKNGHPWGMLGFTNDLKLEGHFQCCEVEGRNYLVVDFGW